MLGRKNYLFVGNVEIGMSIAGQYTLVSTCEMRGINPVAHLADVIPRVQASTQAPARPSNALFMRVRHSSWELPTGARIVGA